MPKAVCQNMKLVRGLEKLMLKSPRYLPDWLPESDVVMPVTVRDLVEFNFVGMPDINEAYDEDYTPKIGRRLNFPHGSRLQRSYRPVFAGDLGHIRPAGPLQYDVDDGDCRGLAPLISAFYNWLEENEPDHGIDIDHSVNKSPWALWLYFEKLVEEKTGYEWSVFFQQEEYETNTGEPQVWDWATMPLYEMWGSGAQVPLLEFLQKLVNWPEKGVMLKRAALPEAAFEIGGMQRIDSAAAAESIFHRLIMDGDIELLSDKWKTALEGISDLPHEAILCDDAAYESQFAVCSARDIDFLFTEGRRIHDMVEAVDPLLDEYVKDQEVFWTDFIRMTNEIAIENPSLTVPVETAAETRIKIKA